MVYDDVTWTTVTNTVESRMKNGSLVHKLIPMRKLRRTTKALNIRLHKYTGIKTYAQYVEAKTAVLRNLSEDDDTDSSTAFSDEDYNKLYKNNRSLKEYVERVSLRNRDCSSEEESDDAHYRTVVQPAKKKQKTTQLQRTKKTKSQRRSPRFTNVGWQKILKRKKHHVRTPSSKSDSSFSESDEYRTANAFLNSPRENIFHVANDNHVVMVSDHESPGKVLKANGSSDAIGTSRNCEIPTNVSNLEPQERESNTENKVVEHCKNDRPDAVKKVKRNLKSILEHFNGTPENQCSLIDNPRDTMYLDKTLQLSQANPICQSTPLNDKKFDNHYSAPLSICAVNHPKDSGIDEDSVEEGLGDWAYVIPDSKKGEECSVEISDKNEKLIGETSKRHSKYDMAELKKDQKYVMEESKDKERNVIEESWNDDKIVTKESKKNANPAKKELRRHGKCNVEELKEEGIGVSKESKKADKRVIKRLEEDGTRDIKKSKKDETQDAEKSKKNVNSIIKESRKHQKSKVTELKDVISVSRELEKDEELKEECGIESLENETQDMEKSKKDETHDAEKSKKNVNSIIRVSRKHQKSKVKELKEEGISVNKESEKDKGCGIERLKKDETDDVKKSKKTDNLVIKESRRHGKYNVDELKEDGFGVIIESNKDDKCAIERSTKNGTQDMEQEYEDLSIQESRNHEKCNVEELKDDGASVNKESKRGDKCVVERLKQDETGDMEKSEKIENCVNEESEDDDDEIVPAMEVNSTASQDIDETVLQSTINNLIHDDSVEAIEKSLLDGMAAAPDVLVNTEMMNQVNQKQKPRVTSTEVVKKRYRIISCSESQVNLDGYAESEDLDICLSMSPHKEAFEELDEEEDEDDTMSDCTKMRLDRLKRLNLIVDSDSCSSMDEDEARNIENTKNKSLKRSIKEDSDEDSIQSHKSIDDPIMKNTLCTNLRNTDVPIRRKRCSWLTPDKTRGATEETPPVLNNDSDEDQENEENMEKQMLSEEVGELESNISILNDSLTSGRPCNLDELMEDEELIVDTAFPSFTMKNMDEDDELYILDIPKTVDDKELLGKKFILTENRLQLGEEKFKASYRDVDFVTCVFGTGKSRKRFKTVNIKPTARIIVRKKSKMPSLIKSQIKSPRDLENCAKGKAHAPKSKRCRLGKYDLSSSAFFEDRKRSVDSME